MVPDEREVWGTVDMRAPMAGEGTESGDQEREEREYEKAGWWGRLWQVMKVF